LKEIAAQQSVGESFSLGCGIHRIAGKASPQILRGQARRFSGGAEMARTFSHKSRRKKDA
jgi:hypothetical protein